MKNQSKQRITSEITKREQLIESGTEETLTRKCFREEEVNEIAGIVDAYYHPIRLARFARAHLLRCEACREKVLQTAMDTDLDSALESILVRLDEREDAEQTALFHVDCGTATLTRPLLRP